MTKIVLPLIISMLLISKPTHEWRLVDHKHWQIISDAPIQPQPITSNKCLPGMVSVSGEMKQDPGKNPWGPDTIEYLQKTTCTKWINREYPERCAAFDRAKWINISSKFKTKPMDFCMDRFEFPNEEGQYPYIYINWYEAQGLCAAQGKRMCTETEWTFACEGEEATPYPTGYTRPVDECHLDKLWIPYSARALYPRTTAGPELNRLWQGYSSGSHPECKSVFGVYDQVGNVDEWARKDRPDGKYPSILKGGYWGPVRTRCRPSTRSHNMNHIFYQQGARCCSDPNLP